MSLLASVGQSSGALCDRDPPWSSSVDLHIAVYLSDRRRSGIGLAANRVDRYIGVMLKSLQGSIAQMESRVTIHMVASLDGFIARRDGRVDWLETTDSFDEGKSMDPELVREFLTTID